MSSVRPAFAAAVLAASLAVGCGPSPALPPSAPVRVVLVPTDRVVKACPCNGDEEDDEEVVVAAAKPVEYVRIDEWEPPPSVREIEARIEPRGDKPADYIRFPQLTLHRDISPTTIYRRGYYWH